jgi:broad specificity phosphatase PhoE
MSHLILVRHAQASFLAADYDRLSVLGEEQARLLGQYWARRRVAFDRIFSGPRRRQIDTARIAAAAYRSAGLEIAEPVSMPEFDEYDGDAILKKCLPGLVERDQTIRGLHDAVLASCCAEEQRKNFQQLFEHLISGWVDGEIDAPGIETWPEFCERVDFGLSKIVSEAKPSEQVVVFLSGGPVAVAMRRALNLSLRDTLRVSWMSRNCSYSEFLFSADRFTLSVFNAFPHLGEAHLLTYR